MRLICPNCDAQYEVPDEVMPHAGRDVQCSNCGNTWFEYHPDHTLGTPQDDDGFEENDFGRNAADADDEVVMPSGRAPEPPVVTRAQRKSLDPAVADILREEAHRETQARQGETAGGIESQPELGLDKGSGTNGEAAQRAREARDRMARMRGADPDYEDATEAAATAAAVGSRRDMLPDIEEINSTLRSTSDRASAMSDDGDYGAPALAKKRNFRSGFLMIILIAVLMLLVYVYAPAIARNIPQLDPALNGYVGLVDQARLWLDGQIVNILQWLDAKADAG